MLGEKPKSKNLKSAEEVHGDNPGDATLEGIQSGDLANFKRIYDDMVAMHNKTKELLLEADEARNVTQITLFMSVAKEVDSNQVGLRGKCNVSRDTDSVSGI